MSTVAFALSIGISVLALLAIAGLISDMLRVRDEDDDSCARTDEELDLEYRWGGGWRV